MTFHISVESFSRFDAETRIPLQDSVSDTVKRHQASTQAPVSQTCTVTHFLQTDYQCMQI